MAQKFNTGGTTSSIGTQFNDKFWSRAAVIEAKKKKVFSQMGDRLTQPKNFGDKIVKYHELPILHASNVNDQGIDANGVTIANGNLYGGSKDLSTQKGAFPTLTEEGGMVNRVGMKRLTLEADVSEFGFYMAFTKRSLEMDTEKGLLARYSRGVGEAQGDIREAQVQASLITQSEQNRVFAGSATSQVTVDETSELTFQSLRNMDKSLKDARCPKDTKLIDGSTKVGTSTVGKARYVYVGAEMIPTLEDMQHNNKDLWVPVEMYASAGNIAEGEIGKIGQFRFIEVEEMPSYQGVGADATGSATHYETDDKFDVFPVLFVGSGSFATVGFEGDVARVTTVMPKADAHNDVYGKKGAVSISWYYGFMTLRPEWIRSINCSAKIA
jgi:N4-gp56 family major capsid protein